MDPLRPLLRLLGPLFRWPGWPRLRALLIVAHVFAVVVVACPAPVRGASKKVWERKGVRAELAAWQHRLGNVGVDVTVDELSDFARGTAERWGKARNVTIAPFITYLRTVGAPQGWYMFTAPDREPQRFVLEVIGGDGHREPVFALGKSVAHPEWISEDFLGEHRVRRALFQAAWSERPGIFKDVCTWFGREVQLKNPDIKAASCSLDEFQVEHPWQRSEKETPARREARRKTLRIELTTPATAPAKTTAATPTTEAK